MQRKAKHLLAQLRKKGRELLLKTKGSVKLSSVKRGPLRRKT